MTAVYISGWTLFNNNMPCVTVYCIFSWEYGPLLAPHNSRAYYIQAIVNKVIELNMSPFTVLFNSVSTFMIWHDSFFSHWN